MSLTGESQGVPMRGLTADQRRQVLYLAVFPNLLLSLHPDYVMTHRMEPVSPARTTVECQWLFAPEAVEAPGSTRRTRSTSGISRTGRTGPRSSPCNGGYRILRSCPECSPSRRATSTDS